MLREIAGYRLRRALYSIDGFSVCDAERSSDEARVLVKSPLADFPAVSEIEQLDRELLLLQEHADCAEILRPIERVDESQNSYLVFEFFAGRPVRTKVDTGSIVEFCGFAASLGRALASLHERGIVHRALSPACVLWDAQAEAIRVTHFAQATSTRFHSASPSLINPCSAPEQTGQLNVATDHRADLYSAGAVLYFALSGQYPFPRTEDLAELAHSLVAREPVHLSAWRPDLPEPIVDFVSRLLAKSPSERPPSASVALEELAAIQARLGTSSYSFSSVPLPGVPPLLGREAELDTLVDAVKHAAGGAMQVVLVEGPAGAGKTRLIEALAERLTHKELFACGKFEQFRRRRPYSAVLSAVESLFDRFLSAPESELEHWRTRLEAIEPAFLAVLAEQVQQIQAIVGPQPKPVRIGLAETENRFHQAFRALVQALCSGSHPVLLVVDDLQWSDDETLKLLAELFFKSRHAFLTLVLAFRPTEAGSPAAQRVAELRRLAASSHPIHVDLRQLDGADVALLCQHFASPCRDAEALAQVVQSGSQGNPLFALEILKRLVQTGELRWSREGLSGSGAWQLERTRLGSALVSDNVVDIIVSRIDALPESCRKVLIAASCIGHGFGFSELRLATELPALELLRALEIACAESLILAESPAAHAAGEVQTASSGKSALPRYSFSHDRVQQAAYSLCAEGERQRLHLIIGRSKLRTVGSSRRALFPAIEHLNRVQELLSSEERKQLGECNFRAGRAAKESVAYPTAIALFELAQASLGESKGPRASRLSFECSLELAESLYLNAEFERAEAAFGVALERAQTLAEEVEVQRTRLVLYQHQQRYAEAIALGLGTLRLLSVRLPEKPGVPRLLSRLAPTMIRARRVPAEQLFERADRATEADRMVLDLLVLLWTPSFWVNQNLNALVVLKLLDISLRLGNTPQAPMAYVCFGILLHVLFKRHERGLQFGRLAYRLVEDGADPFIASRVRFLALTFFGALDRENRANVSMYEEALAKCLESGEHVFAGHTLDGISTSLPIHGFRLPEIERRLSTCETVAEQIGSDSSRELVRVVRAWCRGLSEHPEAASATIDEAELRYDSYRGVHRLLKMVTCYLWDRDDEVCSLAKLLRGNQVVQSNPLHASFYALFSILAACRSRRRFGRRAARRLVERLRRFEAIRSDNFRSMFLLASAEVEWRAGRAEVALDGYHRAISEAAERGHDLIHALACERLAACLEARGDSGAHQEYLSVAAFSYERFGAAGKVTQLLVKYPGVQVGRWTRDGPASGGQAKQLDAEAVMRAAYAIAGETRSERLAQNLLRVITTTAGGERGLLLKRGDDEWNVEAEWRINQPRTDLSGEVGFPQSVIRYVGRTKTSVHLHDSNRDSRFRAEPYFERARTRSALCIPLIHRGEVSAVLYLENGLCADVFTDAQQRLATMLGHQAAIAMAVADYHKVQMDALQAKINPHFLYNALSVIAELVQKEPENAETAVLKLSKLYRYVLSASADQVVTLEQELSIVRDYLVLEQYRFGDKLKVEFRIDGPTEWVRVPALIFQPLVENSVRHGIARKLGPGCVRVDVEVSETHCTMRVEDDGPGWRGGSTEGGFGLRSVRQRLALLYGSDSALTINKSSGVIVEIRIPVTAASSYSSRPPRMHSGIAPRPDAGGGLHAGTTEEGVRRPSDFAKANDA